MDNQFVRDPKMCKITDRRNLEAAISENKEIIIYGAGNIGQAMIRELSDYGFGDYIICCAVTEAFGNPKEIMGIPVLEIKWLPHFRETACFIIAVREEYQMEIYKNLIQFGCKNIKAVDYGYKLELEKKQVDLQDNILTVKALKEEIQRLEAQIYEVYDRVAEQNEVCAVNTETFKSFENCNYGKDIVIVATGPTLTYYHPVENVIHIGMNTAWKRRDIPFDYFFIQDGNKKNKGKEILENLIKYMDCPIFIGRYLRRCQWNRNEFSVQYQKEKHIKRYFVMPSLVENIYQNICFHPLMDFYSVVFPVLHFALYTYPKKIYLVGCDVSDNGHFDSQRNLESWNLPRMKYGYARVKEFAEQYYPETEIISINPVGLKGLFRDEYSNDFLKENK